MLTKVEKKNSRRTQVEGTQDIKLNCPGFQLLFHYRLYDLKGRKYLEMYFHVDFSYRIVV